MKKISATYSFVRNNLRPARRSSRFQGKPKFAKMLLTICLMMVVGQLSAQHITSNVYVENEWGQRVSVATVIESDKPVIFVFWGAICHSCNTGLNALSTQFDEWHDEFDFQVIAVCTDDARGTSKAKNKAKASEWPFTLVFDKNQDFKRAMNVVSVPYFIVTDDQGAIIHSHTGYLPGVEDELYRVLINFYEQ